MRRCSKCGETKAHSEFGRNKTQPLGLNYWCKNCVRVVSKTRYEADPSKVARRAAEWNRTNKVRLYAQKREFRKAIMREIFSFLGGRCEACSESDRRVLQIDHIQGGGSRHRKETNGSYSRYYQKILASVRAVEGKYRLLCANCNLVDCIEKGYRKSLWSEQYLETL